MAPNIILKKKKKKISFTSTYPVFACKVLLHKFAFLEPFLTTIFK